MNTAPPNALQPAILRAARQAGLTLIEVMVAAAMLGIACSATMFALVQMNQNAAIARLQTGATMAVQNQVDQLLIESPFNPQLSGQTPPSLTVTGSAGTASPVTIYQDTAPTLGPSITGTMTTAVTALNPTYNSYQLYEYQATVTVTYSYRNHNHSVSMYILRPSDI